MSGGPVTWLTSIAVPIGVIAPLPALTLRLRMSSTVARLSAFAWV
jgi:hypothetical protein